MELPAQWIEDKAKAMGMTVEQFMVFLNGFVKG